ncbi:MULTISPECIES: response regulator [unclassified Lentimicrobium]|uniref:response regulator n=1 Tax=unclassified Lentimicrobium TaxID=2677434 RepID=UPI0015534246|nr:MULTISPECIES: response regulator [unclassified Lentimicrobium]NPD44701.1 response regulator [Lentimicrobium sp. S6]NPD83443.1 response regulator [Lentimicrobium sp. L6]
MKDAEQIRILLVDDDEIDIMAFKRALKKAEISHSITSFTYAKEALIHLTEHKTNYDCIFIDYLLPGVDGLQLLRQINELDISIPVSVITSHGDEKLAVEIMKEGAFDYFPKSEVRAEQLRKKINSILQYNEIQNEKSQVEKSLQKHKLFLQGITQSSPNIIYIFNMEQREFTYANRNILNDLGFEISEDEVSGYQSIIEQMNKEDAQAAFKYMQEIAENPDYQNSELEFRLKNSKGDWVWFFNKDSIFSRHKNGHVKEIIGTTINISNLKKVEEESANAKEVAEKALEIKAEFLSNMSHEIRTPMNAIIGLTDIVLQEPLTELVKDNLKTIKHSADNLLVVINDILDFSKIEAGKVKIEKTSFNFIYQLEHIEKTMIFKAQQKHLDFNLIIDSDIPEFLLGDPFRLNQIILNLCSNSIKFTDKGHVDIKVKLNRKVGDQVSIHFSVEDSGIGISEDRQKEIFESFTQADVNITRQFGGTGLGLSITKQLIQLMGGQIQLTSELEKGSKFFFDLDFTISKSATKEFDAINYSEKCLAGLNILVFEDNLINQKVISQILLKWGCKFQLADNGLIGIGKMAKESFDIVLMDLQMPVMDGYETTKRIRQGNAGINNIRIPIIALTADAFPETKKKVVDQGMNDLVSKPFKKEVLNHKLYKMAMKHCPEQLSYNQLD